jgi:hypothetical protein
LAEAAVCALALHRVVEGLDAAIKTIAALVEGFWAGVATELGLKKILGQSRGFGRHFWRRLDQIYSTTLVDAIVGRDRLAVDNTPEGLLNAIFGLCQTGRLGKATLLPWTMISGHGFVHDGGLSSERGS